MSAGEQFAPSQAEDPEDPTENQRLCDAALQPGEKYFVLRIITGNDAGSVIELGELDDSSSDTMATVTVFPDS